MDPFCNPGLTILLTYSGDVRLCSRSPSDISPATEQLYGFTAAVKISGISNPLDPGLKKGVINEN